MSPFIRWERSPASLTAPQLPSGFAPPAARLAGRAREPGDWLEEQRSRAIGGEEGWGRGLAPREGGRVAAVALLTALRMPKAEDLAVASGSGSSSEEEEEEKGKVTSALGLPGRAC